MPECPGTLEKLSLAVPLLQTLMLPLTELPMSREEAQKFPLYPSRDYVAGRLRRRKHLHTKGAKGKDSHKESLKPQNIPKISKKRKVGFPKHPNKNKSSKRKNNTSRKILKKTVLFVLKAIHPPSHWRLLRPPCQKILRLPRRALTL